MNRRGFLGLLGSLPFLGFLKKKVVSPKSVSEKVHGSSTWTMNSSTTLQAAWIVDDKGSIVGFVGDCKYYPLRRIVGAKPNEWGGATITGDSNDIISIG